MIFTCHLLAGAIIASKIKVIYLVIPLAFLSHYFLDLLPHVEYSIPYIKERRWFYAFFDFMKVALDLALGVFIILFFSNNYFLAFLGGFFAVLPDGLVFLQLLLPSKVTGIHSAFHDKIHSSRDQKNPLVVIAGIATQVVIVILAIIFLPQL